MDSLVSKDKFNEVNERLYKLGVAEQDLIETFIRGSGKGGQKINKTSSCVQLTYLKTGWVIRCQMSRSREQNRFFARRLLLEKLEKAFLGEKSEKEQRVRKLRLQKKRRSRKAKEKLLQNKKHRSEIKKMRQRPME
jgi:protein subunit release factor B